MWEIKLLLDNGEFYNTTVNKNNTISDIKFYYKVGGIISLSYDNVRVIKELHIYHDKVGEWLKY